MVKTSCPRGRRVAIPMAVQASGTPEPSPKMFWKQADQAADLDAPDPSFRPSPDKGPGVGSGEGRTVKRSRVMTSLFTRWPWQAHEAARTGFAPRDRSIPGCPKWNNIPARSTLRIHPMDHHFPGIDSGVTQAVLFGALGNEIALAWRERPCGLCRMNRDSATDIPAKSLKTN